MTVATLIENTWKAFDEMKKRKENIEK